MDSTKKPYGRICLLDEIRGLAVICMVFYHTMYSLYSVFHIEFAYYVIKFFAPIDPYFGGIFIIISGIVSQLSRSNTKRGLKLMLVAVLITLLTYFFIPDDVIIFGVIHFLSFAMVYFGLTQKLRDKVSTPVGITISIVLTICTAFIETGKIAFFITLPASLYTTDLLCPFGIFSPSFYSADYFPIFPWIFVFLFGTYLGRFAKTGNFPKFTYKSRVPFFSFVGKHALIIYIIHQPIIISTTWLIMFILNKN